MACTNPDNALTTTRVRVARVDAHAVEHLCSHRVLGREDTEEDVLAADVVVAERHRLLGGELERAHRAGRVARVVDGCPSLRRHGSHELGPQIDWLDVE